MRPIIIIPTRLGSTRLPGKALADIHGEPLIVHVWRRGLEADIGPIVVCGDQAIADVVRAAGGEAVLTDPHLPSGSDRVQAALSMIDREQRYDVVVALQGDLPTASPSILRAALEPLQDSQVHIFNFGDYHQDIIRSRAELEAQQVVKIALSYPDGAKRGRAIYFSRNDPRWEGAHYHHIGLYTYRRSALEHYVRLSRGTLEVRESLEQLRALEHGIHIEVIVVDSEPLGVDTQLDLERARQLLS
ncbi:3-deoxy-manno-octulosonate cytidylyltransferase [Microvirga sp. KLBC 81]|uniref:3-deoxy-manno-octulosonate cytidylyltransferase n=1 Tax=Microvirga sp. KLBC 81 TaxID=1862707 RepID=UPI001FE18F10|nr:3-deoxy-manno-octulosonate cytidylyltransferase [Microvirga sp. KLBC 81]